ncbi:MAG: WG repeat-containing protein [Myxococcales bacterium]|nr:WG repeat-containing protein [Myxococcales bacterium]
MQRMAPVHRAIVATEIAPWHGLSVRERGDVIEVRVTNTFAHLWPTLDVVLHYDGCMGKPGSMAKRQRADRIAPGQSVVIRFPKHAGARRDHRASAISLRVLRGRVIVDVTQALRRQGIRVQCQGRSGSWKRSRRTALYGGLMVFETKGGLRGYKDRQGKVRIPAKYGLAEAFNRDGVAQVAGKRGLALIDMTGRVLLRPYNVDNGPDPHRQGLARFKSKGKIGYYAQDGRVVIPARYRYARPFHDGRAAFCRGCKPHAMGEHVAMRGGRWGYIDPSGREVIAATWTSVTNFAKGRATVVDRAGKRHVIDTSGNPPRRRIRK